MTADIKKSSPHNNFLKHQPDPSQFIDLRTVAELAGVSRQKLMLIASDKDLNFPKSHGSKIKNFYIKSEIIQWLKENDIKRIKCTVILEKIAEKKQAESENKVQNLIPWKPTRANLNYR